MQWAVWNGVTNPYKQTYTTKPKPFAPSHCETAGVNFGYVSGLKHHAFG
jgi:hypothetical protein